MINEADAVRGTKHQVRNRLSKTRNKREETERQILELKAKMPKEEEVGAELCHMPARAAFIRVSRKICMHIMFQFTHSKRRTVMYMSKKEGPNCFESIHYACFCTNEHAGSQKFIYTRACFVAHFENLHARVCMFELFDTIFMMLRTWLPFHKPLISSAS
jgi:hypothetical protein